MLPQVKEYFIHVYQPLKALDPFNPWKEMVENIRRSIR